MDTDGHNAAKPLTGNGDEHAFVWLDSDTLLFPSKRGAVGAGETAFYRLSLQGGEAERAFCVPLEVESFHPLSNGCYLLTGRRPCEATEQRCDRAKLGQDYWAFDELPFWSDGIGKISRTRRSGFLFNPATGALRQFTEKYFELAGAEVAPSGDRILCWGATYTDLRPTTDTLCLYDNTGSLTRTLETGLALSFADWWGEDLLLEGTVPNCDAPQGPTHFLLAPGVATLTPFPAPAAALGSTCENELCYGSGRLRRAKPNGYYATQICAGETTLLHLTKDGKCTPLGHFDGVSAFDICDGTFFCTACENGLPAELYSFGTNTGKTRHTSFHDAFLKTHALCVPERFSYQNRHGCTLKGWVMKPADYQQNQSYPGVLVIHSKANTLCGEQHCHELQCLAAQGMFVFYTIPHGSSGTISEFANLTGVRGGLDYADLMDFTDAVLHRYPDLDEKRLGVSGSGYGGYLVNWIIGHTNRFQGACAQHCVSNCYTASLTGDLAFRLLSDSTDGASPWKNDEVLWEHSPLKYVGNAVTPTLFIHSDEDYRTWLCEPLQMFTNLRQRDIPSKVLLFRGEHHDLSQSGSPKNRQTRLHAMCDWFAAYLNKRR